MPDPDAPIKFTECAQYTTQVKEPAGSRHQLNLQVKVVV